MKKAFTLDLIGAVMNYLATKPFNEVHQFISELSKEINSSPLLPEEGKKADNVTDLKKKD